MYRAITLFALTLGGAPLACAQSPTLAEIVETDGRFNTLESLLNATGLMTRLEGSAPTTLFAPTDAAFNALGPLPEGTDVENVLLYHMLGKSVPLPVQNGRTDTTLNGQDVTWTFTAFQQRINEANLTDQRFASNGHFYVIDKVLIPPPDTRTASPTSSPTESLSPTASPAPTPAPITPAPTSTPSAAPTDTSGGTTGPPTIFLSGSLAEKVVNNGFLNTYERLLRETGLMFPLQSDDNTITLFAPTDEAFANITIPETDATAKEDLVGDHYAFGTYVDLANTTDGDLVTTITGEDIVLMQLTSTNWTANGANILISIPATNGILHVIDEVLFV